MAESLHPLFAGILRMHFPMLDAKPADMQCETCGSDSWVRCDDSFDHAFGTHRERPYLECTVCGETADIPEAQP